MSPECLPPKCRVLAFLTCSLLVVSACAAGRPGANRLPDPAAVTKVVRALADSLDVGRIEWVWAAPDGTCWLCFRESRRFGAIRRIGPDGRVLVPDVVLPGGVESAHPLAALPGGDLLMFCVMDSRADPPPGALCRIGTAEVEAWGPQQNVLSFSDRTTFVDGRGLVHAFGNSYIAGQAYLRYSAANDTLVELSHRRFDESRAWTQESGYKVVSPQTKTPWGGGSPLVARWDGGGLVVGAATTEWRSETTVVSRFRVPECELLEYRKFKAASAAQCKTLGIDDGGYHIVKSGRGYWLFVPGVDSMTVGQQKVPCIYSCRLDADLNPIRTPSMSDLTTRPFSEAPPGSSVALSLRSDHGRGYYVPMGAPRTSSLLLSFSAFAPDGRVYRTEMRESVVTRQRLSDGGLLQVIGGGDSVGPVSVSVPAYPGFARIAHTEGQAVVTTFAGTNAEVDSAVLLRSSCNWMLDEAALAAARKARFAGTGFRKGSRPIACDLTYRFTLLVPGAEVRVVEAHLRQN